MFLYLLKYDGSLSEDIKQKNKILLSYWKDCLMWSDIDTKYPWQPSDGDKYPQTIMKERDYWAGKVLKDAIKIDKLEKKIVDFLVQGINYTNYTWQTQVDRYECLFYQYLLHKSMSQMDIAAQNLHYPYPKSGIRFEPLDKLHPLTEENVWKKTLPPTAA